MNEKKKPNILPKDIVKNVFDRPKLGKVQVSSIFTHGNNARKIITSRQREAPEIPHHVKPLPVALDIGTTSVKIMRLGIDDKRRFEVIDIDTEPYETSDGVNTLLAIKNALETLRIRNKTGSSCVSTLPGKDAEVYNMMFPPMSDEELESAIQFKIAQLKPFGLSREKLVCKFKKWTISGNIGTNSQQRVVVVCVPKEALTRHITLLKDAGFNPLSVETPQASLVNLSGWRASEEVQYEEDVELWVHVGSAESFLAIAKNKSLCFAKKIDLVSSMMTKNIAKRCRIPESEAEAIKKEHGFSFFSKDKDLLSPAEHVASPNNQEKGAEEVYYALVSLLENLVVEIEHSFKHFSFQVAQSQITRFNKIVLSGGGANLKNLEEFLSVRLGVPVSRFDTFSAFKVSESVKKQRAELVEDSAVFTMVASLSIGQKMSQTEILNFLPNEDKNILSLLQTSMKQRPVQIIAGILFVVVLLSSVQAGIAAVNKTRMEDAAKKVQSAKSNQSKSKTLQIDLAKRESTLLDREKLLEAQLRLLKEASRGEVDVSDMLSSVASLLPEQIWINSLKYGEGRLLITGSTVNLVLITELIEKIKGTDAFFDAKFSYTQKEAQSEVYSFEIEALSALSL